MRHRILSTAILLSALTGQSAWADLTLRYRMALRAGTGMPPELSKSLEKASSAVPTSFVTYIQGDKARSEILGKTVLMNYLERRVTVLDIPGKRVASSPLDEFLKTLPSSSSSIPPEAAELLRNIKFDAQTRSTGRTETINGIRAEETATVITASVPIPQTPGLMLQVEISAWRPVADEVARLPQFREYASWSSRATALTNPVEMINTMLGTIPGFGDQMRTVLEAIYGDTSRPALRVVTGVGMPGIMNLLRQQAAQQGRDMPTGFDLSGSLLEVTMEMAELSNDPLQPGLFSVPANLRSVSITEIMKPQTVVAPTPPPAGEVFRVGGGVTAPRLLSRRQPEYTQEARRDRAEGTVVLNVVVGSDGLAHNIQVVKSLRPDLDQKAIEAVTQWRFTPAAKDGKPVNAAATIEVNFRLLHDPPAKQ